MSLILFAGRDYYPMGGGGDFVAVVDSVEAGHDRTLTLNTGEVDWAHVLDVDLGELVAEWHVLALVDGAYVEGPLEWIDGSLGYIPTEYVPPPPAPESSDGVKDRAWVEAWYAAKGPQFDAPREDAYDEVVVAGGDVLYLRVRSIEGGGGWQFDVLSWDAYQYCPHWNWEVSGKHATEQMAWDDARRGVAGVAAKWARWRAKREAELADG